MRALVTGAKGMLGTEVIKTLEMRGHEVWGTDISSKDNVLDITRPDQIRYAVASFKPEWIINCAAYTNVDGAENHEEEAIMLNAKGPEMLALSCKKHKIKLLQLSTDYVFDGKKDTAYIEDDIPNPINAYGMSKLAGEIAIRHIMDEYIIVRTQWLIGLYGRNFVSTIISAAQVNNILRVVNDQWGSPTFACDLSKAIAKLVEMDVRGIYHVCNRGKASWYDLAKKTIDLIGLDTKVIPVSTDEFPRPAKRPAFSILSTKKFTTKTGKVMPLWQASLEDHIHAFMQHVKGSA